MLEFNETAHRQLAYAREEFARVSIPELEAAEKPEETRARIAKVIREGRDDFETRHRTRQGDICDIRVTALSMEQNIQPKALDLNATVTGMLKMLRRLIGEDIEVATVFGIIKQNLGLINVYSEPSQGTVFRICLPRAQAPPEGAAAPETARRSARGTETVLLVEDEPQNLHPARRILAQQGYTVLTASRPEAALAAAGLHGAPIHLLITDVVMPGLNGKGLLERLRGGHPQLKCLFMSGYTADVIAHRGVLDDGVQFL